MHASSAHPPGFSAPKAHPSADDSPHPAPADAYSDLAAHWSRLDASRVFLNHGSFGACPDAVLLRQQQLRDELEADTVAFMVERLADLWADAKQRLAAMLNADAEGLAFLTNATTGVNTVLRSLRFEPGDEILTNAHEYNACLNAAEFVMRRAGGRLVRAPLGERGGHVASPQQVVEQMLAHVTPRTRLALLSHVTSPTGLVLPIEQLTRELEHRGVDVLIDGAHALGMLPINLHTLGASYYTANCHKWLCAPKGAACLWVRHDKRGDWHDLDRDASGVRPLTISHGMNAADRDTPRFQAEFDWQGTFDPTPMLSVPTAIDSLAAMTGAGWPAVMAHNRDLALRARDILIQRLGLEPLGPDDMIGSLAALRLPDRPGDADAAPTGMGMTYPEQLQRRLVAGDWSGRVPIQVPIIPWTNQQGEPGGRLVRISAHLYNAPHAYDLLATALEELMHKV